MSEIDDEEESTLSIEGESKKSSKEKEEVKGKRDSTIRRKRKGC